MEVVSIFSQAQHYSAVDFCYYDTFGIEAEYFYFEHIEFIFVSKADILTVILMAIILVSQLFRRYNRAVDVDYYDTVGI